jgi:23S rRNA-/tRNA-specific pseudouridylate synthase
VHCKSGLNCEIIGDLKYGTGFYDFMPEFNEWDHIFLHSREVSLPYFENKKRVVVIAPLYDHFKKMMNRFGFNEKNYPQSLK